MHGEGTQAESSSLPKLGWSWESGEAKMARILRAQYQKVVNCTKRELWILQKVLIKYSA